MELWMTQLGKLLAWMLGNPSTQIEGVVVGIAGVLAFLLILTKVGDLLGAGISTAGRSFAVLVVTLAAWFALSAAAAIYGASRVPAETVKWIPVGSAVLVFLVISVPLTRLFQKTKYGKGVFLMAVTIGGAIALMLLVGQAFRAAREGSKEGAKLKERTSEVNDLMSK